MAITGLGDYLLGHSDMAMTDKFAPFNLRTAVWTTILERGCYS